MDGKEKLALARAELEIMAVVNQKKSKTARPHRGATVRRPQQSC